MTDETTTGSSHSNTQQLIAVSTTGESISDTSIGGAPAAVASEKLIENLADFISACTNGNVRALETLAKKYQTEKSSLLFDIHDTNNTNLTPLMLAAANGHTQVIDMLISIFGFNPNDSTSEAIHWSQVTGFWTALHSAAEGGHAKAVQCLLQYKACVYSQTSKGFTPLHVAAASKVENIPTIQCLIDAAAKVSLTQIAKITHASKKSNAALPIVNWQCYPLHRTALHEAVACGKIRTVRELIFRGHAFLDLSDHRNKSPFYIACQSNKVALVKMFLNETKVSIEGAPLKNKTPLRAAAMQGYADIIETLILHKANMNAAENTGWTALSFAAAYGQLDCVKLLVKFHACVDNVPHANPLILACHYGYSHVIRFLILEAKANIDVVHEGLSPLAVAARQSNYGAVNMLLWHGNVSVNRKTAETGRTPLHIATLAPHTTKRRCASMFDTHRVHISKLGCCRSLLQAGIGTDVHSPDLQGNTALHYACNQHDVEVIQVIIGHLQKQYRQLMTTMLLIHQRIASDFKSSVHCDQKNTSLRSFFKRLPKEILIAMIRNYLDPVETALKQKNNQGETVCDYLQLHPDTLSRLHLMKRL